MNYTIFIRPVIEPKFIQVPVYGDEMDGDGSSDKPVRYDQQLNPFTRPKYPESFIACVWYAREMDYYGDSGDPNKRGELWEDPEGKATYEEILKVFPNVVSGYYDIMIRSHFADFLAKLARPYSDVERETWHVQQREAEAWQADKKASIPMLTALATQRGIPVDLLAEKIAENVKLFTAASGEILGRQQAMLDRIYSAKSLEEVNKIATEVCIDMFEQTRQQVKTRAY